MSKETQETHVIPEFWLAAYHDGELKEAHRQQVKAHLASCAECRRKLDALESLSELLSADELTSQAILNGAAAWDRLASQLPGPAQATPAPLSWLPGIGLLMLNGLVQLGAAVGVAFVFIANLLDWPSSPAITWLSRAATDWTLGWFAWLVPAQWGHLGLVLAYIVISASLAIVYLAWLSYGWRYRWSLTARTGSMTLQIGSMVR